MQDIITYVSDRPALIAELHADHPDLIDDDDNFLVDKTPSVYNGTESLALIRADDDLVALGNTLTNLTLLGTYDEVFADVDKKIIYDRVYDQTPVDYTDEEGNPQTYTPPEKFGVFAD